MLTQPMMVGGRRPSFGAAFYPALGLLIWAVIAGIDAQAQSDLR